MFQICDVCLYITVSNYNKTQRVTKNNYGEESQGEKTADFYAIWDNQIIIIPFVDQRSDFC